MSIHRARLAFLASETIAPSELIEQPHDAVIPVLMPIKLPAVFAHDNDRVLVTGQEGWAWVVLSANKLSFASFDELLATTVAIDMLPVLLIGCSFFGPLVIPEGTGY